MVLVIIIQEDHMDNLKKLCDNVLQKVRDHYGKVVSVSSGYRSPELCLKIGSSAKSQHANLLACRMVN